MLSLLVCAGLAHAGSLSAPPPPPPPPLRLSTEEQAQLAAREVVVRYPGPGQETTAVIDISAPPPVVMREVMDLAARKDEIGGVQSLDIYEEGPGHMAARWEVGIAFVGAVFHIQYDYDVATGWCVYALDTARENTIVSSVGSYQVYATEGGSRMVYRSTSEGSASTPDWVRKKLAYSSARELLAGIRGRAEAG